MCPNYFPCRRQALVTLGHVRVPVSIAAPTPEPLTTALSVDGY